MRFLLLSVFLLVSTAYSCFCQDSVQVHSTVEDFPDSVFVVDTVTITGNAHTKDFVILREMSLHPGALITRDLLEYDKNRIYSLGLFTEVVLKVMPTTSGKATIDVDVRERWYIYPYPIFGIKDRDWSKLFYGAGLAHLNFRGRDEKLFATFVFGYDPMVALSYRNPFLSEEGTYYLEGHLSYSTEQNQSILAEEDTANFDERHFSVSTTIGRRFGIHHNVWAQLGYDIISVPDFLPGRTLSPNGKDSYPNLQIGYTYDSRDLSEYPHLGSLAQFTITKYGVPGATIDFIRYATDLRRYVPLVGAFDWTVRAYSDIVAAGPTPPYNHVYFGYGERIRGHFDEVMEGENLLGLSTELHFTILPPRYFFVGFLPQEFGVWKFGIVAAAFGDAGTVWFRHDPLALVNVAKGYGLGLHFLLPYSAVLRTEYAWNEARRGQFIIDAGAAF